VKLGRARGWGESAGRASLLYSRTDLARSRLSFQTPALSAGVILEEAVRQRIARVTVIWPPLQPNRAQE
jgi:hypothetical protein